jgi:hypothetical protein
MRGIFFPVKALFGQEFPTEVYADTHMILTLLKWTMTYRLQFLLMRRMSLLWSGNIDIAVSQQNKAMGLLDYISKIE